MLLFRNKVFTAVTVGHFVIDIFNSMGGVLVTFLSIPLALSTAQIGLALSAYSLLAAITQPLFGWLADKIGSRWLGPGSVTWTISFMALAVFMAQTTNNFILFMIPFSLAAIGSGAFHPLATMHSTTAVASQAAMGTGMFFLFGQGGLAGGPILGGLMLDHIGMVGVYVMVFLTIPFLVFMTYAMRHTSVQPAPEPAPHSNITQARIANKESPRWGAIAMLALITGLRSWVFLGTVNFLPKMFQDMGWEATAYGLITGAYWIASGITGVIGGNLADRWGRRQVVFVTLLLGSVPIYFLPLHDNWVAFVLAIISGGLLGASHSILIVIAQALLPGRRAFASGVTLGYLFGTGALAAWGMGALADIWGLNSVIQAGAVVGVATALLALFLPATRETPQPQAESVPAQQGLTADG
jgi:FSR family fosmidomycin resistance protein-like MFS transporter